MKVYCVFESWWEDGCHFRKELMKIFSDATKVKPYIEKMKEFEYDDDEETWWEVEVKEVE